ncbi:hypothetical protein GCM10023108_26730 [Saccharopolyspora hordei]|uniref:Uncharacterized protein n=1 Tax=Saccharopolyspora hordei TaxID=1838 RepID=A0A853ANY2_9PSEU|nr:hypothetical protein [Saccharopolyspora hordei]
MPFPSCASASLAHPIGQRGARGHHVSISVTTVRDRATAERNGTVSRKGLENRRAESREKDVGKCVTKSVPPTIR